MLIDDNIPWTEEDKQVLIDDISSLLKEQREQREEVEERMEGLMGKEHAKEMGDNLEMLYGQRQCVICGTNPEKQRELVLSILKGNKKL